MTKDEIQALVDEMACADCFTQRQLLLALLALLTNGIPVITPEE